MLIFAEQFTLVLPREITMPSSSWVEIRCSMPQYGREAFLEHYYPGQVEIDDLIACGTSCSTWVGHVVAVDLSDPEIVTVECEPLRRGYSHHWDRQWQQSSASRFGDLGGGLRWDEDREAWMQGRPGGVPYNPQLVGECAVAAYPGGDVSVTSLTKPVFAGRSGHAATFEEYVALRLTVEAQEAQ